MTEHNDRDLGERFHALRREDAAAAPALHATFAAARARAATTPRRRTLALGAAAIVLAGVALALLLARRAVPTGLATVRLRTPTDFLLALPNEDLLRTVPHFITIDSPRRTP